MAPSVDRKRFLFVVPVFKDVDAQPFANFLAIALSAAKKEGDRYEFMPYVPERQSLPVAMNKVAEIVLSEKLDGAIVADDDCQPPYDAVSQLLRRYEAGHPVVLAAGFMKNFPHTTTLGRYYPEGPSLVTNEKEGTQEFQGFYWIDNIDDEPTEDGLIPVDFGGMPVALISASAFRAIKPPWFGLSIDGGNCTHDVYFGVKCARAKIPIVADLRIRCGHLAPPMWVTFENRAQIRLMNKAWKQAQAQAKVIEARQTSGND